MKKLSWLILSALLCALFFSCSDIKRDKKGREDFSVFIDKFYSDIDFQLSRIEFPVPGSKLENGKFELIEKEDWTILKPVDQKNPDYLVRNIELAENLIEHHIVVKRAFIIKLYFTLNPVTKEWYLSSFPGITGSNPKYKLPVNEEQTKNPVTVTPDTTYE
jgi:hypothetical protein